MSKDKTERGNVNAMLSFLLSVIWYFEYFSLVWFHMPYFSICYLATLQYIEITFLYFHMKIIHPEFDFSFVMWKNMPAKLILLELLFGLQNDLCYMIFLLLTVIYTYFLSWIFLRFKSWFLFIFCCLFQSETSSMLVCTAVMTMVVAIISC